MGGILLTEPKVYYFSQSSHSLPTKWACAHAKDCRQLSRPRLALVSFHLIFFLILPKSWVMLYYSICAQSGLDEYLFTPRQKPKGYCYELLPPSVRPLTFRFLAIQGAFLQSSWIIIIFGLWVLNRWGKRKIKRFFEIRISRVKKMQNYLPKLCLFCQNHCFRSTGCISSWIITIFGL